MEDEYEHCCDSHFIGSDPKAINDFGDPITLTVKCDHGK